jgi:hypothetical protein
MIKDQKRLNRELEKDARKMREFQNKLKKETIQTFKDVPDEINQIFVIYSHHDSINVKWDPPESNNLPILSYNIYISESYHSNIGYA